MLKRTIAYSSLVAILASSAFTQGAIAGSMERDIISIANNGISVRDREPTRLRKKGPAHWKTTVYNWDNNTRKSLNGYVPPAKKQ